MGETQIFVLNNKIDKRAKSLTAHKIRERNEIGYIPTSEVFFATITRAFRKALEENNIPHDANNFFLSPIEVETSSDTEMKKAVEGEFSLHAMRTLGRMGKEIDREGYPQDIANALQEIEMVRDAQIVGQYVNITLEPQLFFDGVTNQILRLGHRYGEGDELKDESIVLDYSGPNVAKKMHIGHLRSTLIGESLKRILNARGAATIGINHLGDWGVNFGMIIAAREQFGTSEQEKEIGTNPVEILDTWYKAARNVEKLNENLKRETPSFDDLQEREELFETLKDLDPTFSEDLATSYTESFISKVRTIYGELESGEGDVAKQWIDIREWSIRDYQKMYDTFGITLDLEQGESFYEDKMNAVIEDLEKEKITINMKDGALVIPFRKHKKQVSLAQDLIDDPSEILTREGEKLKQYIEDEKIALLTVLSSDQRTVYATRDLATMKYRTETFDPHKMLYVVASEQIDHFRQCFAVAEKLGYINKETCEHLHFGLLTDAKGKKLSSRSGKAPTIDGLLKEVSDKYSKIMAEAEKSSETLEGEHEDLLSLLSTNTIAWNDLVHPKESNVAFDLNKITDLRGKTGSYMGYMAARCKGIVRKAEEEYGINIKNSGNSEIFSDNDLELCDAEKRLLIQLALYPRMVEQAAERFSPNILAEQLFNIAQAFSTLYSFEDANGEKYRFLGNNDKQLDSRRVRLAKCVETVLSNGMQLLVMKAPEKM